MRETLSVSAACVTYVPGLYTSVRGRAGDEVRELTFNIRIVFYLTLRLPQSVDRFFGLATSLIRDFLN